MSYLTYQDDGGQTVTVSLASGVDPDAAAARLVPAGRPYEKHPGSPPSVPSSEPPASLNPAQWSFLRRRDGGRLGAVIEAAKDAMPPGDAADMFAAIVDDSTAIRLDTVLALTARVRAMGSVPNVPTDDEIRAAWPIALAATPKALLAALGA